MVKWSKDLQIWPQTFGQMESRTQWQLYRMFQQQQDESLHSSYVPTTAPPPPPPADEVRDTLACPAARWATTGMGVAAPAVGVAGCSSGESKLPFPPPPLPPVEEVPPKMLLVARVRNQQSMGVGLPFMITGPRYSKWNESSWLIAIQRSLQKGKEKGADAISFRAEGTV